MKGSLLSIGAVAVVGAVGLAGAGVALAADGGRESRGEASYTRAHRADAAVSEQAARATALGRHAGTVVDAHLQNEGRLVWEFVIARHGQRSEVQVDARTGDITSDQPDD
jgi:uncharacterized membrane protein YkoI